MLADKLVLPVEYDSCLRADQTGRRAEAKSVGVAADVSFFRFGSGQQYFCHNPLCLTGSIFIFCLFLHIFSYLVIERDTLSTYFSYHVA